MSVDGAAPPRPARWRTAQTPACATAAASRRGHEGSVAFLLQK
jgi:hypothetical protein